MIDWLRYVGYTVLGFVILIGFLGVGWLTRTRFKSWQFRHRVIASTKKHIQDSQRGRRPLWVDDREKNDQSRVDRRS